ncbi:MAG: hypothetical protein ABSG80_06615 [Verrucomicrobiota bacterium]
MPAVGSRQFNRREENAERKIQNSSRPFSFCGKTEKSFSFQPLAFSLAIMPFTVTHPLGRPPTFPELQALARQHDVQIDGNELAGSFCHPDPNQPKVTGNYTFEPNGGIHGDFTSPIMGKLTGTFVFTTGKAEVTITEKPFLLPEAVLKSKLSAGLKEFCAKFPA